MTDNVLNFLEETGGKKLRVVFKDGYTVDCTFSGFSYDYDDNDDEILELDFERWSDGVTFLAVPREIEKIEVF